MKNKIILLLTTICILSTGCSEMDVETDLPFSGNLISSNDGIHINVEYTGNNNKTQATVTITSDSLIPDEMCLYLNETPIQGIQTLPWSKTFNVGMLYAGYYKFVLKYQIDTIQNSVGTSFSVGGNLYKTNSNYQMYNKCSMETNVIRYRSENKTLLTIKCSSTNIDYDRMVIYKNGEAIDSSSMSPYELFIDYDDLTIEDKTDTYETAFFVGDFTYHIIMNLTINKNKASIKSETYYNH